MEKKKTLIKAVVEMRDKFKDKKSKNKYDIYRDKKWVCDSCGCYAHDMYLIEMKDRRELCPDCFLKEKGVIK
jgi:rubrerythrin